MLIVNLEYSDDRYAVLEYGNAFRWGEHYVLIQGTEGAIKLDLFNTEVLFVLKVKENHTS